MHNQMIGSTGVDQQNHLAPDNSFGQNDSWVDMSTTYQHHPTTMADYGSGFTYNMAPVTTHGLPSESLNRMPPPPPPQQPQPISQAPASHHQLPMLMMPSHSTWPSMLLTNPNHNAGYGQPPHSAPPVAIPPVVSAPSQLKTKLQPLMTTTSQPRKTLTDDDRRRMCQYAEDHPNAKQTEIGLEFGVERSTVSKVLRHRDKYLNPEDRSSSPIKRAKGKGADIEKALTNWLRNAQKTGVSVSHQLVEEKASIFASTMSSKPMNALALEKFMQKHGISTPGKLLRRASETNIPDHGRGSPALTNSQPASAISPASPMVHPSPSPLSANRSDEDRGDGGLSSNFMDFSGENGAYKHSNTQSATSLNSAFTDATTSSFSSSALSPTTPFNFSPSGDVAGFLDHSRIPPGSSNFQRPRSQTFPTLDLEYMNQGQSSTAEPSTPKYNVSSTAPSSALESPAHELAQPHFTIDGAVASASPQLRHSSSNGSIAARSAATPITGSSPSSPTQDDARRAADTLLSFIQNSTGFVDQNEYLAVVRLTEKLRIHQTQMVKVQGMGGLSRIPEGDSEMTNASTVDGLIKVEATMGV
ncbi:hypothetical protein GQ53DRAFT_63787 [Thozetella sp. PMI_491]|nr:hypothetical protein GQ53DRAFT_63787 [Thozetella sp. PMI_491]